MKPDSDRVSGFVAPSSDVAQTQAGQLLPGSSPPTPFTNVPTAGQLPQISAAAVPAPGVSRASTEIPQAGDEGAGLIDQAISQAKSVIQNTANDPRAQSQSIERLKAGYLNARYHMSVKLSEN